MMFVQDAISLFVKGRYAHEEYTTVVEVLVKEKMKARVRVMALSFGFDDLLRRKHLNRAAVDRFL
jgi:hypothetical protein